MTFSLPDLFLWALLLYLEFPSPLSKFGLFVHPPTPTRSRSSAHFQSLPCPVSSFLWFLQPTLNYLFPKAIWSFSVLIYSFSLNMRLAADWFQYFFGILTYRSYSRKLVRLPDSLCSVGRLTWANWTDDTGLRAMIICMNSQG